MGMKRIARHASLGLWALASLAALATPARADETTFCNAYITSLPYTISAQGHYCFDRNLSTAITSGAAITINTDFVVLDLNNFKLGGGAAGLGTTAYGVYAANRRNITIRNGNIRGFYWGIFLGPLNGTAGGNYTIENNVLDGNTAIGIVAYGDLMTIRDNVISNTGGATPPSGALGIYAYATTVGSVEHNLIANSFSASSFVTGVINNSAYGVNDHNVAQLGTAAGTKYGIVSFYVICVCRDNTVFNATSGQALVCTQVGHNYNTP
jgi:hypothetical protein